MLKNLLLYYQLNFEEKSALSIQKKFYAKEFIINEENFIFGRWPRQYLNKCTVCSVIKSETVKVNAEIFFS